MNCETYEEAMMALLDGELTESEAQDFYAHCRQCSKCRAEFEAISLLTKELEALGDVLYADVLAPDLVAAVLERVAPEKDATLLSLHEDAGAAEIMAYVDEELDELSQTRFDRRMAHDPRLQAEIADYRVLRADLEALGQDLAAAAPTIDFLEDVMSAVGATSASPKVAPFRTRPKPSTAPPARRTAGRRAWLGLAAAAVFILGLSLLAWLGGVPMSTREIRVAQQPLAPPAADRTGSDSDDKDRTASEDHSEFVPVSPPVSVPRSVGPVELEDTGPKTDTGKREPSQGLTLEEVLKARRKALLDGVDRLSLMSQWASLTPEEARELISKSGLSREALIGAAQFLPPDEAEAVLKAAVSQSPDDPYLRYALAKNYCQDQQHAAEALEQLNAWSNLDPENSLPLYMEAQLRFAQNDPEGALGALETAASYGSASSYGLGAAAYGEQALVANGMAPDVARFLVATTAGSTQSSAVTDLGRELVRYGQYYASLGDYNTAKQVYNAVRQMGVQLVEGAALSNEQLAGLDTQVVALDAFQQLYSIFEDPANQMILTAAYNTVLDSLALLGTFFASFDALLSAANPNTANQIASEVIRNGDLNILSIFGF